MDGNAVVPRGSDVMQRLREVMWRAELLADVEEQVEKVTCRGEGICYDGPSEQVTGWRRQAGQLLALLERPLAPGERDEAMAEAARLVKLLEQHAGQDVGGADSAAPPTSA
ncbi:hypothetical protein ACF09H_29490 [Streptomyces sp. NPDC014983]|uniref:hypothetical protein n=1 Tax=Streptomyces sp. NPDC014983 TaxID=3364933 RepID=UPI0036FB623F